MREATVKFVPNPQVKLFRPMNIVKLLSTADVMKAAAVGRETLRFYEEKGLIEPVTRSAAGYRKFAPQVVALIGFIKDTQAAGFSLKEIQELLRLRGSATNTCDNVTDILNRKRAAIDDELALLQRRQSIIAEMIVNCCTVNDCAPSRASA